MRCTKTGRKCDGYLDDAALAIRRRRRRRAVASPLDDPLVSELQAVANWTSAAIAAASGSVLSSMTPPFPATTIPRLPGLLSWETAQEKRSFEFFQHITAPILAGDLDAIFWRVLVLQICHTEPAVRHAVLAISSLHEALLRISSVPPTGDSSKSAGPSSPQNCKNSTTHQHEFALQQYNKAIAYLLEEMKTTNSEAGVDDTREINPTVCNGLALPLRRPVAPLMTCVLFVCIEVMQGKDRDALIHLEQGRHLLGQLDSTRFATTETGSNVTPSSATTGHAPAKATRDTDPEMAVVRQHIVPLYTRLSMTSFLFGCNPEPIPPSLKTTKAGRIPSTFDSIHALRAAIHDFLDDVLRFTLRSRPIKFPTTVPQRRASSSSYSLSRSPSPSPSSPPSSPLSPSPLVSIQSPPPSIPTEASKSKTLPTSSQTKIALCELESDREALSAQLGRLRVALSLFRVNQLTAVTASANPNAAALALLQIHLCIAEIWLATALTRAEATYDAHTETFSTIVSLAVTVLEAEQQQRQKQQQQQQNQKHYQPGDPASVTPSVFTLETHVIPALYYVATKCRHGLVRNAALALLKRNSSRRENLWRADVLGAIAARIIEIEEEYVAVENEDVRRESNGACASTIKKEEIRQATSTCAGPDTISIQNELDFGLNSLSTCAPAEAAAMATAPDLLIAGFSAVPVLTELDQWGYEEQLCGGEDGFLIDNFFIDATAPTSRGSWHGSVAENGEAAGEQVQAQAKVPVSSSSLTPCLVSSAATPTPGYLKNRSTEAPFDVPEQARVHTAMIGPEEAKGRWVTLFQKLQGLEGAWEVRVEFVASWSS